MVIVFLLSLNFPEYSFSAETDRENQEIIIDAYDLKIASIALSNFKKINEKWTCFDVKISNVAENYIVSFIAKDNVSKEGDVFIVNNSKCGRGITYILDKHGKITNRIFPK